MNPFEMVVAIVLITVIGGVIRSKLKHQSGNPDKFEGYLDEAGVTGQLQKIDQLEERIKVLERIVTDKNRSLADEIDNL
ncbi:MAG: hypothetical protein ACE5EM_07300 [Sphingomonadales bacterium]